MIIAHGFGGCNLARVLSCDVGGARLDLTYTIKRLESKGETRQTIEKVLILKRAGMLAETPDSSGRSPGRDTVERRANAL